MCVSLNTGKLTGVYLKIMIIELTGIPGVGKTVIFGKLKEQLKENGKFVFSVKGKILESFGLRFSDGNLIGDILFDGFLFLIFLWNRQWNSSVTRNVFKTVFEGKNSIFFKINILRNVMKKISVNLFCENNKKFHGLTFIIDEGVTHIPFNLFADSGAERDEIENILRALRLPKMVILVDDDEEEIFRRLKSRGHKRIKVNDDAQIKYFISKNREIMTRVKFYLKGHNIDVREVANNTADFETNMCRLTSYMKENTGE